MTNRQQKRAQRKKLQEARRRHRQEAEWELRRAKDRLQQELQREVTLPTRVQKPSMADVLLTAVMASFIGKNQ